MGQLHADAMAVTRINSIEKMSLDYTLSLVGIGFDGASVKSSHLKGVKKLIRDKALLAHYVLCYVHRLKLVPVDTVKVKFSSCR